MGQKVNPHGIRVGIIKGWDSVWYAGKDEFSTFLVEDNKIRRIVKEEEQIRKEWVEGLGKRERREMNEEGKRRAI